MINKAYTCTCGCGNTIIVHILDDSIYLSFAVSGECLIKDKRRYKLKRKKDKMIIDILLSDDDFFSLFRDISSIKYQDGSISHHRNASFVKFYYDKDLGFYLELYTNRKIMHNHKVSEIFEIELDSETKEEYRSNMQLCMAK